MDDDLVKRITALERVQDKLLSTLDQINATLLKFEKHIDELFDMKSKLDSIDVMWKRIDELQKTNSTIDKEFHVLKSEHNACVPLVGSMNSCKSDFEHRLKDLEKSKESASGFTKNLVGGLLGQIIWGLIVAGSFAAMYLAGKGAFKP